MVGFMNLEEQVDVDFGRAHRRALPGGLVARLRGEPRALPFLDEVGRASFGGAPATHNRRRTGTIASAWPAIMGWR